MSSQILLILRLLHYSNNGPNLVGDNMSLASGLKEHAIIVDIDLYDQIALLRFLKPICRLASPFVDFFH